MNREAVIRLEVAIGMVALSLLLVHCTSVHAPVTLTFVDQEWGPPTFNEERELELRQFTHETGIQVKLLPSPESTREQLALWRDLLRPGVSGPDVYTIDVIWPGILNEDFIDLKPYFASEISKDFPAITASYTVDHKLVAVPYNANLGLLYYRTDLLREYGYRNPPGTWDELESMAARIQAGERAKVRKAKNQFWGFVWQGAATEALTCNALEWQAAEGGGQVIEKDKTISVNNPDAIRAWQRAARWIGSISPPSVVGYKEWDSLNVWLAGDAAFMRNWTLGLSYAETQEAGSPIRNKFDVSLLPAGKAGRVSTFGGTGLAISRFSTHPRESVQLVRYLVSRDVQIRRSRLLSEAPVRPELYELREVLEPNPRFAILNQVFRTGIVSRPSNITGKNYEEVSSAYMQAIHSVLTGERSAPESAKALENELVRITGFKQGPPAGGSGRP